jgi:uncharacterized membrane protein YkoI
MPRSALLAAWLCLLPAAYLPAAQAADHESTRRAVQAGRLKPLAEILASVQTTHAGRVLDVELEHDAAGRQWYEIKLLNKDGQKVEIHVDAVTGRELGGQDRPQARVKPLSEVLRQLLAQQPGLIKHAELEEQRDGRRVYEITVELADGREQRFVADALTGRLLSTDANRLRMGAGLKPLPDLIDEMERRYRGRAVEVEIKMNAKGLPYYEIELELPNGRGLEVSVDAATGKVLREETND